MGWGGVGLISQRHVSPWQRQRLAAMRSEKPDGICRLVEQMLIICWIYMLNRCGVCDEFTWIIYVGFMLVRCWIDVEYIQSRVEANQWTLGFCLSNMVTPICARLRDDRPLLVEFPLKVDSWRHWVPHSGWAARRAPGWRRSLMYSCQGPPRTGRWVSAKENN